MKIYATLLSEALKLPLEEIKTLIDNDNYEQYIEEVKMKKGTKKENVPEDKFLVIRGKEELLVSFSQLNTTTYHFQKHSAENEIYNTLSHYYEQQITSDPLVILK